MSESAQANLFQFDNSYARDLEGFYAPWKAESVSLPKLLFLNKALAEELGLDVGQLSDEVAAAIFSGNEEPSGAESLAQAYAGHQFGGFSQQLGDGRALLLGEVIDRSGVRRDIQLKGSGPTPFSRGGDGRSPLGPVLREYLMAEAMAALGVPTTRALAAVATGDTVFREGPLPGGVFTRVAASHIRVGTFEYFAARRETDKVKQLADYAIERHYPDLLGPDLSGPALSDPELVDGLSALEGYTPYLGLLEAVARRQADLVAEWMLIGFIHGVMNTDNTTISGETIDYGPCAFMDQYDPATVFSSIDRGGRYAFANQPGIAGWNMARFAETLLPLLSDEEEQAIELANEALGAFSETFESRWLRGFQDKLGLSWKRNSEDAALAHDFLELMQAARVDFTQGFRGLADVVELSDVASLSEPPGPNSSRTETPQAGVEFWRSAATAEPRLKGWFLRWKDRLLEQGGVEGTEIGSSMRAKSPLYIARNHLVEEALQEAVQNGSFSKFEALHELLKAPFEAQPDVDDYERPAPPGAAPHRTFCGT